MFKEILRKNVFLKDKDVSLTTFQKFIFFFFSFLRLSRESTAIKLFIFGITSNFER